MSTTTRWTDNQTKDLDTAISLLCDEVLDEDGPSAILWQNWNLHKCFDNNKETKLNGLDISYNMVRATYNQISMRKGPVEERTQEKSFYVIVYRIKSNVNYIIDQNTNAQKALRKLLSYTGKNEIEKSTFPFHDLFFIWLISKVYRDDNVIEATSDNTHDLQLEAIKSVRGDSDDLQNKVTATGESVMNLISTLSFLLESKKLKQIKIDLKYYQHENINLTLIKDGVSIDLSSYQGIYEKKEEDEKIALLYLLVYLEILPTLDQQYHDEIENQLWNGEEYKKFINDIANEISRKINDKLNNLSDEDCLVNY